MRETDRLVVYVLIALLIVGVPLEAKACADDCGWGASPDQTAIASSNSSNVPPDDSVCCASCICCHGYAADPSAASPAVLEPISRLSVDAPERMLNGTHCALEKPPRR